MILKIKTILELALRTGTGIEHLPNQGILKREVSLFC